VLTDDLVNQPGVGMWSSAGRVTIGTAGCLFLARKLKKVHYRPT